jgi:hypothetical protein
MDNRVVIHATTCIYEIFIHTVSVPFRRNERYRFIFEGYFYKRKKNTLYLSWKLSYPMSDVPEAVQNPRSSGTVISRRAGFFLFFISRKQPQRPRRKGRCEGKVDVDFLPYLRELPREVGHFSCRCKRLSLSPDIDTVSPISISTSARGYKPHFFHPSRNTTRIAWRKSRERTIFA